MSHPIQATSRPAPSVGPSSRRGRAGFTLLEILIVIGIIALLVALSVIGFKVVGGMSRNRVTQTAMENCKSLLAEYKLTNSVGNLLDTGTINAMMVPPAPGIGFRWQQPATGVTADVTSCRVSVPDVLASDGSVQSNLDTRAINDRYLRDETARVLRRLTSVKENRAAVEAMPPNQIDKVRVPIDPTTPLPVPMSGAEPEYSYTPAANYFDGTTLRDGDGHPIYFIPGGGLMWVNIGYLGHGDRGDKNNYDRQMLIQAPDRGPFWASPGPDGDLSTGDDNVYSFQN